MTKEQKKVFGWKQAIRQAIERMRAVGLIEMSDNRFLIIFDRELTDENEKSIAETLGLKFKDTGFAYTFNAETKIKPFNVFKNAEVIAIYDNMIIYDKKIEENLLSGLKDLQFSFKTQIYIFETKYRG